LVYCAWIALVPIFHASCLGFGLGGHLLFETLTVASQSGCQSLPGMISTSKGGNLKKHSGVVECLEGFGVVTCSLKVFHQVAIMSSADWDCPWLVKD